jgi:hypothetical protein
VVETWRFARRLERRGRSNPVAEKIITGLAQIVGKNLGRKIRLLEIALKSIGYESIVKSY